MTSTFYIPEQSVEAGQPIYLLHFSDGSRHWRYNTGPEDIVVDAETYTAQAGVKGGKIEIARNAFRTRYELELPWSCPFGQAYLAAPPDGIVTLTVHRFHTLTTPGDWPYGWGVYGGGVYPYYPAATWWRGYVQDVSFRPSHRLIVRCVPSYTQLGRAGLCLRWGRACQVPLYSTACGIDRADHAATGTVTAVSGYTVTADVFDTEDDGYWVGGEIVTSAYRRLIIAHADTVVTLAATIPGLAASDSFTVYPGCDHAMSTCRDKFSNLVNYRGQPYIPTQNPFVDGTR